MELQKAKEESDRAKKMVEQQQCTPPKKSSKLLRTMNGPSDFLEPLPTKKTKLDNQREGIPMGDRTNLQDFNEQKSILTREFSFNDNSFLKKRQQKKIDKENQISDFDSQVAK